MLDTTEAIGGKPVGEIVEGNCRFASEVRFPQDEWATVGAIGNLRVGDSEGISSLGQLVDIKDQEGPAQIRCEYKATENHGCV